MAKRLHTRYGTWSHAAFLLEREKEIIMIMTRHMRRNSHSAEKKYMPLAKKKWGHRKLTASWQKNTAQEVFLKGVLLLHTSPIPSPMSIYMMVQIIGNKTSQGQRAAFPGICRRQCPAIQKGMTRRLRKGLSMAVKTISGRYFLILIRDHRLILCLFLLLLWLWFLHCKM